VLLSFSDELEELVKRFQYEQLVHGIASRPLRAKQILIILIPLPVALLDRLLQLLGLLRCRTLRPHWCSPLLLRTSSRSECPQSIFARRRTRKFRPRHSEVLKDFTHLLILGMLDAFIILLGHV